MFYMKQMKVEIKLSHFRRVCCCPDYITFFFICCVCYSENLKHNLQLYHTRTKKCCQLTARLIVRLDGVVSIITRQPSDMFVTDADVLLSKTLDCNRSISALSEFYVFNMTVVRYIIFS